MIYIENKRRKIERIQAQYPNADILDITSTSPARYAQMLSPFYPHGGIPIPLDSNGLTATCVEAIWQGLKVFEKEDVNFKTFSNDSMKGLKRTIRKLGAPKGHRDGAYGHNLLGYFEARMKIYLPSYKWVLENIPEVKSIILKISERAKDHDIVFLDYNTNADFRDTSSPMSHAGLVKLFIEGKYPAPDEKIKPLSPEEIAKKKAKTNKKNKHNQQTLF
ncbi:MAG: DUF6939 family protein [Porphyromonas sp.]